MNVRIEQFAGLSQGKNEGLVPLTHSPDAVNVSTAGGALRPMRGDLRFADAALTGGIGTLCAFYRRADGVSDTRLLAVNESGVWELQNGSWTERYAASGAMSASTLNYQKNGNDVILIADGTRPVLIWDGVNAMTALTAAPACFSQLALHYERVWGSGVAGEPDAVYWSRAFDPENWSGDEDAPESAGGVVMIPTWNGGRVIALRTLFDDVLVFKENDLYRIVGTYPGNYEVVRVHGVVGPVAKNSIAATADACYFLSRDGLCVYNGVSVAPLTQADAKTVFSRVTPSASAKACAVISKNTLYLALPLDGAQENNAVLEIDLTRGAHLLRAGVCVRCFLETGDGLLFGGTDGRVYRYGAGEALGAAKWQTPWTDFGNPGSIKRLESLSMIARGSFLATVETERSRYARRIQLGNNPRPVTLPIPVGGRRARVTFESVDAADFEIAPGAALCLEQE